MPENCHGKTDDELTQLLGAEVIAEGQRIEAITNIEEIKKEVQEYFEKLRASLAADSDVWKELIPGRPLLGQFSSVAGLPGHRAKSLYLATALELDPGPFAEIREIFASFAAQ